MQAQADKLVEIVQKAEKKTAVKPLLTAAVLIDQAQKHISNYPTAFDKGLRILREAKALTPPDSVNALKIDDLQKEIIHSRQAWAMKEWQRATQPIATMLQKSHYDSALNAINNMSQDWLHFIGNAKQQLIDDINKQAIQECNSVLTHIEKSLDEINMKNADVTLQMAKQHFWVYGNISYKSGKSQYERRAQNIVTKIENVSEHTERQKRIYWQERKNSLLGMIILQQTEQLKRN